MPSYVIVTEPQGGAVIWAREVLSSSDLYDAFHSHAERIARAMPDDEVPPVDGPGIWSLFDRRESHAQHIAGILRQRWEETPRGKAFSCRLLSKDQLVTVWSSGRAEW